MANNYDIGDAVRVSVAFTSNGSAADPTAVALKVQDPSGNEDTYTYALGQVTKDSTGNYHKDVTVDEAGTWFYRWTGTGVVVAASEGNFVVRRSVF